MHATRQVVFTQPVKSLTPSRWLGTVDMLMFDSHNESWIVCLCYICRYHTSFFFFLFSFYQTVATISMTTPPWPQPFL